MKYSDVVDLIFGMELTFDEILDNFDTNCIAALYTGYTLPPGIYQIGDLNMTLHSLLPNIIEVDNTIDDIRLQSNLATKKNKKIH